MLSKRLTTLPYDDGFRMPGEFEPHAGCWMLFPERPDVWGRDPLPAQRAFAAVAEAIARFEPVWMGVSAKTRTVARQLLPEHVHIVEIEADDSWMRDNGPTFVVNDRGDVRGVDWEFNAWGGELGGLYQSWERDNQVARQVMAHVGVDCYKTQLVNEGGAIHVDGEGTLITTRSVLLNPNRNPNLSEAQVEQILRDYLSIEKVIWLDVPDEDETDGHVDGVCAFVRPGVLLISWPEVEESADLPFYQSIYDQLANATDARGRSFELIKIPVVDLPPVTQAEADAVLDVAGTFPRRAGDPVWGGYVNFYIANGGVVFPLFDLPTDEKARRILQQAFPSHEIVGVRGARLISMCGGIIHCITQQQPRG
ncbi:MAG: agmatine deiminase [Chloroflexota bacterium]